LRRFAVQTWATARRNVTARIRHGFDSALVVTAGEVGDPTRRASHTARRMVGEFAAGNQMERTPPQFLLRVATRAVAAVEFIGRQVRLERDASWHRRVLQYLRWLRKSV
jgi:hypothetical protein